MLLPYDPHAGPLRHPIKNPHTSVAIAFLSLQDLLMDHEHKILHLGGYMLTLFQLHMLIVLDML